jgi:hypothetical protein
MRMLMVSAACWIAVSSGIALSDEPAGKEQEPSPELRVKVVELIGKLESDDGNHDAVRAIIAEGPQAKAVLEEMVKQREGTAFSVLLQRVSRTIDEKERIESLVSQLGDESFNVRETATQALLDSGGGWLTLSAVQKALESADTEVSARARTIFDTLDPASNGFEHSGTAVKVPDQKVLLLRTKEGKYGAVRFTASGSDEDGSNPWAEYEWCFQPDGSGDFTNGKRMGPGTSVLMRAPC